MKALKQMSSILFGGAIGWYLAESYHFDHYQRCIVTFLVVTTLAVLAIERRVTQEDKKP